MNGPLASGIVMNKTNKASVLPLFSKIEHGDGSAPQSNGDLSLPGHIRHATLAALL